MGYKALAPTPYFSCEEIATAALIQGFSPQQARVVAGIAMAESGGNASATAVTPHERSIGIMQVNTKVHAFSDECLRSLGCSVAVAWKISNQGTSWDPWSVFTSGAYLKQAMCVWPWANHT